MRQEKNSWLRFLRWFCPPSLYEGIEGDLLEQFEADAKALGEKKAKWRLRWSVISFFRPGIVLRNRISLKVNSSGMYRSQFVVAYRGMSKKPLFFSITILGLAIGLAALFFIGSYVRHELSFDSQADQLYRVQLNYYENGALVSGSALGYRELGPVAKESFSAVEEFTRLAKSESSVFFNNNAGEPVSFNEPFSFYGDRSVFALFPVKWISGNWGVQADRNAVAMSESLARKYFGAENPIGKTLSVSNQWASGTYKVGGIFADLPPNSHLTMNVVLPIENMMAHQDIAKDWWFWSVYTYIKLRSDTNVKDFETRYSDLVLSHTAPDASENPSFKAMPIALQQVKDIHLYSKLESEIKANGSGESVYVLAGAGLFLLLVVLFNHINLSAIRFIERSKEIGIRKTLGSSSKDFLFQFFIETLLIIFMATALSFGICLSGASLLKEVTGISLHYLSWLDGVCLLGIVLFIAVLMSIYPVIYFSRQKSASMLKGVVVSKSAGISLRQKLIVFQFATSMILIVGSLVVYKQIQFIRSMDLGLNADQVLLVRGSLQPPTSPEVVSGSLTLKNALRGHPKVLGVTALSEVPGQEVSAWGRFHVMQENKEGPLVAAAIIGVDSDFVETLGFRLLAGRSFLPEHGSQRTSAVVVSELAVKELGIASPEAAIGMDVTDLFGDPHKIIGVVNDHHQRSARHQVDPTIFYIHPLWPKNFYAVKLGTASGSLSDVIANVEKVWLASFPKEPFEYSFLNERIDSIYKADKQFGTVIAIFASLSILVASLGLFSLSAFAAVRRTKEIGIRKVMGASIGNLLILLSSEFVRLVLIASCLALPVAYFFMSEWLSAYVYRTSLDLLVFALPVLLLLLITLITVVGKALQAAKANPINSLRYE